MKGSTKSRESNNGDTVVKNIPLAEIRTDKTQSRAKIDDDTVEEYAELMDDGVVLPPIVAYWDGETYWLGDGGHRYRAALSRGLESIACEVRQGTFRDALKYSLNANVAHGLRRTNEDKRKAVGIALSDEEWAKWSNGAIAELCGVSKNFVGTVRVKIEESEVSSDDSCEVDRPQTRVGRDGKKRCVKKRRPAIKISGGTWPDPVKIAEEPIKTGAPVVSEKDKRIALNLLTELGAALEMLGLSEQYSYSLEKMRADVEALELCDSKVHS